jgi:hypothetical protein
MFKNKVNPVDFWSPIALIIKSACSDFDNIWIKRKRIIDTHLLIIFILKLIMRKINRVTQVFLLNYGKMKRYGHLS